MSISQVISFFVIGMFFPMGSAELWQRVYATRSKIELRKSIMIASGTFLIIGIVLSVICLRLRSTIPTGMDVDLGLINGIAAVLGRGFVGLWVIAFVSAILSSADTFVYTAASSWVRDVAGRIGWLQDVNSIRFIRCVMLALIVLGFLGALLIKQVVDVTFLFAGFTMIIGAVAIAAWAVPFIPGWGITLAVSFGTLCGIVVSLFQGITVLTAAIGLGGAVIMLIVIGIITRNRKFLKMNEL